jgi:hypothetical protein
MDGTLVDVPICILLYGKDDLAYWVFVSQAG